MDKIIDLHLKFFEKICSDTSICKELNDRGISILQGFNQNVDLVKRFYNKHYSNKSNSRIVLCGINPGKRGAGLTGIPFIDFASASHLLPDIPNDKWELSAKFIYSVIESIGVNEFFDNVYLTNISWFGFVKGNNNLNYYKLPSHLQTVFTASFIDEMKIVNPKVIIPLSEEVEKTILDMHKSGMLEYKLSPRLNHPYWCSINRDNRPEISKQIYIKTILNYIKKQIDSLL